MSTDFMDVVTWRDASDVWHARVTYPKGSDPLHIELAAREYILDELRQRESAAQPIDASLFDVSCTDHDVTDDGGGIMEFVESWDCHDEYGCCTDEQEFS